MPLQTQLQDCAIAAKLIWGIHFVISVLIYISKSTLELIKKSCQMWLREKHQLELMAHLSS